MGVLLCRVAALQFLKVTRWWGAYGVGGATSQQDDEIANCVRQKVGWSHQPANDATSPEVKKHIDELYEPAGLSHRKL